MKRMLRMAVAALALAGLSGCVVAPAGPAPYAYGYAPGYAIYPPPVTLGFGFGGCFDCGWHRHYWR